jgi:hypothetical protein
MKLWQRLYLMIWLLFFECLLVAHLFPTIVITALHVVLGAAVLALALANARALAAEPVPARLKRICQSTANLAIAQAVFGLVLGALKHAPLHLPSFLATVVAVFHLIIALAMITQAASVATAYDMRDEQELIDGPRKDAPPPGAKAPKAA